MAANVLVAVALVVFYGIALPAHSRVGYFAVLAIASVVFIPAGVVSAGPLTSILGPLVAVALSLGGLVVGRRQPRWPRHFHLYAATVVIGAGAAIPVNSESLFAPTIAVASLVFAATLGGLTDREWLAVSRGVIVIGLVTAALCITETFALNRLLLAGEGFGLNPLFDGRVRAQATLGHPIVAGFFMLTAIAFTLLSQRNIIVRVTSAAILMVGVLATGSSSSLAIAVVALVSVWVARASSKSMGAGRLAVTAAGAVVVLTRVNLDPLIGDLSGVNTAHRLNAFRAIPNLLEDQSIRALLFGNGYVPLDPLYQRGVLINDRFFTLDNQYVSVLVASGVVGFALFAVYLCRVAFGNPLRQTVTFLLLGAMFLSFDVLQWAPSAFLFAIAGAWAVRRSRNVSESGTVLSPPLIPESLTR